MARGNRKMTSDFQTRLTELINMMGMDTYFNIPDCLLAQYLIDCLYAYAQLSDSRIQHVQQTVSDMSDAKPPDNRST